MQNPKRVYIILAFLAIYIIWGSTYLFNKIAVSELPPFLLGGLRFTVAGLLIFCMAAILGKPIRITVQQAKNTLIAGFLFLTLGNGLAVWALQYIDSGFAALEIAAQPLVVLLMLWALQGKRVQAMSWIGIVLGFIGLYLLIEQSEIQVNAGAYKGIALIAVCMLCWGYGSIFVGRADLPQNHFVNTGYQMLFGGIFLLLSGWAVGEELSAPTTWSEQVLVSMLFLVFFGSVVAFTSFNYLLKHVSPEKVATNTYVNPVVALFLGWYVLQEPISGQSVLAAVILLTGVYFVNSNRKLPTLLRNRRF